MKSQPARKRPPARRTRSRPSASLAINEVMDLLQGIAACRLGWDGAMDEQLADVIRDLASTPDFTAEECSLLLHAICGTTRGELCRARRLSENTVKPQVRKLLKKIGAETLDEAGLKVLRAVVATGQAPARAARKRSR